MGWARFLRRDRWDKERARELESYLDEETNDNVARGMTPDAARFAARKKLGNTTTIREEIYRMNSLGLFETLWQDVRYGARALRRSPGYAAVALMSLALGIAATTSIFSAVYGVLIAPYPYAKAGEIWAPLIIDAANPRRQGFSVHQMRDFVELRKLPAFSAAMATRPEGRLLTAPRGPENFSAIGVTSNAFQFLGVAPLLGRAIEPSDIRPDGNPEPVLVLAYKAWQRLFDRSSSAIGQTVVLNDQKFTVIGVMPPRFGWWTDDGGWVILPEDPRDRGMAAAIFRLKPGVSAAGAAQQVQALHLQFAKEHPDDFPRSGFTTVLQNYLDITSVADETSSSLRLLFGAVGFLLLIACANVANLQLARATARGHELSVRSAIGAGRGRLFRQLLTESLVLSFAGGAIGVGLAFGITRVLVAMIPPSYVPNEARITINLWVLAFSATLAVLTGILSGVAPALKGLRADLIEALKGAGRMSAGRGAGRTRQALVIAQVALSVVLLVGASLAMRGFVQLQSTDTGFHADRVLMVNLQMSPKVYSTYQQRIGFSERVLAAMADLPGVQSVALGNGGLPYGGPRTAYSIEGQTAPDSRQLLVSLISADYPQTMGIPLRAGRALGRDEVARAEPFALINETAARLWPAGASPIGARVRLNLLATQDRRFILAPNATPVVTVAGVLADTRNDGLRNAPLPAIYLPYTTIAPAGRTLALRSQVAPETLLNAVRERVRALDKDQPLSRPITLKDVIGTEMAQPRFNLALFACFSAIGLALAGAGIYSVLSYAVSRRTREIGIRVAFGAARQDVLGMFLLMGGRLMLIGLTVGLIAAIALTRWARSALFQLPDLDFAALASVAAILTAVGLASCVLPARRAARLDATSALRDE